MDRDNNNNVNDSFEKPSIFEAMYTDRLSDEQKSYEHRQHTKNNCDIYRNFYDSGSVR